MDTGGLLLLDGLDEVPEARRRRTQLKQAVEDFAKTFGNCRVLVTSRTYAYQRQDWRLAGYAEALLTSFDALQIRHFVDRWYAHIAALRGMAAEDAQGRAEVLKGAIFAGDRLQALAERPLLLTLMASLHAWRGGSLPEKREQLYADTVDLLLDVWESPKTVRDAQGKVRVLQDSLGEWLKVDRARVRELLNRLAYEAHAAQPDLSGTADVPEGDLVTGLMRLADNPDANPARLLDYLRDRAGLLLPRGEGVYTFPHRTFQEYLAACHLTDADYPEQVADLARGELNRWREVALLAGAKAARGSASTVWNLADALCYREPDDAEYADTDGVGALLAGQALAESADLINVSDRNQPKLGRVQRGLVHVLGGSALPAIERAQAGDALAALGDPRFRSDTWQLPDEPLLGFVEISKGSFLMGSDPERDGDAFDDEQPQHEHNLDTYYMARYPVTVAQFRAYVDDNGQAPEDADSLRGRPNHPVVRVTWREAVAYCEWLTGKLREWEGAQQPLAGLLRDNGWRISLPSEAQWEKAARGTDGRVFPWGDEPDPERANYIETGIGETSGVGCFPGGASPYGLLDMSGNVDEWTRSLWGEDLMEPQYGYPYDPLDGRESLDASDEIRRVVRGGSFPYLRRLVRCASRLRNGPNFRYGDIGFRVCASPDLL